MKTQKSESKVYVNGKDMSDKCISWNVEQVPPVSWPWAGQW